MNIQDEMQNIHHKYGVSEKANYEIEKFVEKLIEKGRAEQLILHPVSESFDKQELREAYNSGAVNINCHGECMVDSDKDFKECVEWIIKERD